MINQFGRHGEYYLTSCVGRLADIFTQEGVEVRFSHATVAVDD
jgi:hypothetical protein